MACGSIYIYWADAFIVIGCDYQAFNRKTGYKLNVNNIAMASVHIFEFYTEPTF